MRVHARSQLIQMLNERLVLAVQRQVGLQREVAVVVGQMIVGVILG